MNKKIIAVLTAALLLSANGIGAYTFAAGPKMILAEAQGTKQSLFNINTVIAKVMGTVKDSNIVPKADINGVIASVRDLKSTLAQCYNSGRDLSVAQNAQVIKDIKNINYSYFCTANNDQLLKLFLELDGLYTLYDNFKKAGSTKFNKVYLALNINRLPVKTPISNFMFGTQNIYSVYQTAIAPLIKNFKLTDLGKISTIKDKLKTLNGDKFANIDPEGLVKRANLYELVLISHSIATLKKVSDLLAPVQNIINKAKALPF